MRLNLDFKRRTRLPRLPHPDGDATGLYSGSSFELERNDMLPQGAALGRKSRLLWDFFRYHVELVSLCRPKEVIIGMSAASRLELSKCSRHGAHCDVDREGVPACRRYRLSFRH